MGIISLVILKGLKGLILGRLKGLLSGQKGQKGEGGWVRGLKGQLLAFY